MQPERSNSLKRWSLLAATVLVNCAIGFVLGHVGAPDIALVPFIAWCALTAFFMGMFTYRRWPPPVELSVWERRPQG